MSLAFPTGERSTSVLLIETSNLSEKRKGEALEYRLKVTNISDNIHLENVMIHQINDSSFEVTKSEPMSSRRTTSNSQGTQGKASGRNETEWSIGRLAPDETKAIHVTAVGHTVGVKSMCLTASYQVALCLTTRIVAPDLDLTRKAPETVDLCEPFTITYNVKNTGKAAARDVVIREKLPEYLSTQDGKQTVELKLDQLEAGGKKSFEQKITAKKAADYTGRASASSSTVKQTYSQEQTTQIQAPELKVSIDGNEEAQVKQPISYKITVANNGEVDAQDTRLTVNVSDPGHVVRNTLEGKEEGKTSWNLGTVKAGQSRTVRITALSQGEGTIKVQANAQSKCAMATRMAQAKATIETETISLPALRLVVYDEHDPVALNGKTTYKIGVLNQGSGPDHNVKVNVTLPKQLQVMDVSGETDGKVDGQTVTLNPVDTLKAGERVEWEITVKATEIADVRTTARLTSDYLEKPLPDVEPTRIVKMTKESSGSTEKNKDDSASTNKNKDGSKSTNKNKDNQ